MSQDRFEAWWAVTGQGPNGAPADEAKRKSLARRAWTARTADDRAEGAAEATSRIRALVEAAARSSTLGTEAAMFALLAAIDAPVAEAERCCGGWGDQHEPLCPAMTEPTTRTGYESKPAPPDPASNTVRVRIAVAVSPEGKWASRGGSYLDPRHPPRWALDELALNMDHRATCFVHWVEAAVPIPIAATIPGRVVPEKGGEGK